MAMRTLRHPLLTMADMAYYVPAHVQEARNWIAAWKARQIPATARTAPAVSQMPPPHVQEARDWIAAWRARQTPAPTALDANPSGTHRIVVAAPSMVENAPGPIIAADGTLSYSKTLLDGLTYDDLLKALSAKQKK